MELFGSFQFSPLLAASLEGTIIFIIFVVVTAIYNAVKKKGESSGDWSTGETPRPTVPHQTRQGGYVPPKSAPPKQADWEEELRRMLQGGTAGPATSPPPIPQPATTPLRREPLHVPPPHRPEPAMSLPPVFEQEKFYKAHCTHCGGHLEFPASGTGQTIECPLCQKATVLRPFQHTAVETLSHRREIAPLKEATSHLHQASLMDERVAQEMSDVGRKPVGSTFVEDFKVRSLENEHVIALLRTPRTARQVVIASLLLSPPKSLES